MTSKPSTELDNRWEVDPTILGLAIDQSLRDLVNCWVRGEVPTKEQAEAVNTARLDLAYLQARARSAQ
jgi:hypothetical protein